MVRFAFMLTILLTGFLETYGTEPVEPISNPVIDSLQTARLHLERQLQEIDSLIQVHQRKQIVEQYPKTDDLPASVTIKAVGQTLPKLRSKPGVMGKTLAHPPSGSKLPVVGFSQDYWAVEYNGTVGYVSDMFIVQTEELKDRKNRIRNIQDLLAQEIQSIRSELESREIWIKVMEANVRSSPTTDSEVAAKFTMGDRLFRRGDSAGWINVFWEKDFDTEDLDPMQLTVEDLYHSGWIYSTLISHDKVSRPSEAYLRRLQYLEANPDVEPIYQNAIRSGQVKLGMSKGMVTASIGFPIDVNRTVGTFGVHEQWVYGENPRYRKYIYFENGIVTSWQD